MARLVDALEAAMESFAAIPRTRAVERALDDIAVGLMTGVVIALAIIRPTLPVAAVLVLLRVL